MKIRGNVVGTNMKPKKIADRFPVATSDTLGSVMPVSRTDNMTQAVGVDENGCLWTHPSADVGDIETALDSIIAIQNALIGGDAE